MDRLESRMEGLETRLDGVDSRLERVESRLERVDADLVSIHGKISDVHGAISTQTRWILATLGMFLVTFTGSAVTILVKLLPFLDLLTKRMAV